MTIKIEMRRITLIANTWIVDNQSIGVLKISSFAGCHRNSNFFLFCFKDSQNNSLTKFVLRPFSMNDYEYIDTRATLQNTAMFHCQTSQFPY